MTVETDDDTDYGEIEVLGSADFEVDSISVSDPVDPSDTETVSACIDNVGGSSGEKTVLLEVDGSIEESKQISISGDTTGKPVSFDWETPSDGGDAFRRCCN